jgi:A-macroglobulin TED domain/Alpha-2-macroglobulin family/A-macroglobulin receptor binding domain/MG2 domain/Carboxypeptidase regulatory-like domain/Alpha-2-macroglobulin bait region domain/Macroglobulin domain MG3
MWSNFRKTPLDRFVVSVVSLLVVLMAAALVKTFAGAEKTGEWSTYSHGVLRVVIPYRAAQAGAGRLTAEVLDPENHVIGRTEKTVEVIKGASRFRAEMKLDKAVPLDELVWHRVRYEFRYDDTKVETLEGVESISNILRLPVLRVLGQQSYLAGSRAAVRLIVSDAKGDVIPGRGAVRIALEADGKEQRTLFTGRLNHRGTTEAQFQFPEGVTGNCTLHYTVDTSLGATEYTQTIRLQDKVGILLTTDKTIYQPGQKIYVRALALNRADHRAVGKRSLLLEVEDSHGNKVFKKATSTDEFGIGSADFGLASEVNLGTYHVRATLGEAGADSTNTAEIALDVEKYVLPKFKVELNFATPEGKKKHGYRPGDHVSGTVQANYFFGKALDGAEVSVKAEGIDVTTFTAASVAGNTDHDGAYHFDLQLPGYLAGKPLDRDAAKVLIEATVKDTAGHSESRGEPITISESAFLLTAIPEGGTLVPGLENQVFLVASYPDGTPVEANLKVRSRSGDEQDVSTNAGGLAVLTLKKPQRDEVLQLDATDKEGEIVSAPVLLRARAGDDQVLLRAEKAVYRAGDSMRLRILTTKKRGTVYVDVVKDGQTILTRDLDIAEGEAELTLAASPELAGTVDVSAYMFGTNAQPVADHRLVFVQPADELKVETVADRPVYKPGDDSHISFHVTDKNGAGVRAALGLQIVDEAVFALAEKKPGFAKVFFYLEQEVMKPRYEIHSVGLPEIVEPVSDDKEAQRDVAARVLFSATEIVRQNRFDGEAGREIPRTKYYEFWNRYQAQFQEDAKKIAAELRHAIASDPNENDPEKAFQKLADSGKPDFRDAWGTKLKVERTPWDNAKTMFMLHGAGPDKNFDTADDLRAALYFRRSPIVTTAAAGGTKLSVKIEHDRGPNNNRAETSGLAIDPSGAVIPDAIITITNMTISSAQVAHTDASGEFHASALRPGIYRVTVSSPGFRQAEDTFQLEGRDHAEITARLEVGSASEMVEVSASSVVILSADAGGVGEGTASGAGFAGGVAGGAMGGVMGGVVARQAWAVPAAKPMPMLATELPLTRKNVSQMATVGAADNETANVHVRSYFPETLYINPEIITDRNGMAEISVPLADNITTWRMSMIASTQRGTLGTATSSLKVFQDFFVDLDVPVVLTQGDQVSLPVAIYNYTDAKGEVRLKLKDEDWFALVDDSGEKSANVDSQHVGGSQFTLEAKRIGKFKLTLTAQMSGHTNRADVVVREIEVVPNGREQNIVFNGQLESKASHTVEFPPTAIDGASKIFVRLYPGPLSQIIEGMDSILRMPSGCFEQTSSSTYPNVLALDYMKRTKKLTPEVHAKAEGYIANGYQRLLTFEVQSGGFSWFGQAPANKILTSYGLLEFYDMSKVHDVDLRVIQRTQQWLVSQQQADGSWKPDTQFINEGATNRYNKDVLRITAYIAWSLGNTGYQGPALGKSSEYIRQNLSEKSDPYTLAVLANFAVDSGKDPEFTRQAIQMLLDARTEKDEQAWWSSEETGVYSTGTSASVETTGLAVQALLKWGRAPGTTRKALAYITSKKDATGAWGSTQATIMALRALLLASENGTADLRGTVEIAVNGKTAEKLVLTPENNDLLHQFVFKEIESGGSNLVEIRYDGKGTLGYQTAGQYFIPWDQEGEKEPFSISVNYDRTKLVQDDIVTATATMRNNLPKSANMVMVDLGIPPGFDLLSEDLQEYQKRSSKLKSGRLEKSSLTATQAILYFNAFAAGETVELKFRLRAKYPIRTRTFQSRVYEYYDPDVRSVARPVSLEVKKQ